MDNLCIIVSPTEVEVARNFLQELHLNDCNRRLKHMKESGKVAIPIQSCRDDGSVSDLRNKLAEKFRCESSHVEIKQLSLPQAKKLKIKSPEQLLKERLQMVLQDHGYMWSEEVQHDIPTHWERHGDLVLIPDSAFCQPVWKHIGTDVWKAVCECMLCTQVARKSVVSTDGFRRPQVTLLYGDNTWVQHVDNGIKYSYDVTKCMFSPGNITEKLRVASFNCTDETVVDMYAGIGYFTLPYLVYTGVKHLHACEWNQDAVEALHRNLALNNVQDRCIVHYGDNRKVCPEGLADRVNLGLIPSSRDGWPVACRALKPDMGGILHIHFNVNTKPGTVTFQCNTVECEETDSVMTELRGSSSNSSTQSDIGTTRFESFRREARSVITSNTYENNTTYEYIENILKDVHSLAETRNGRETCIDGSSPTVDHSKNHNTVDSPLSTSMTKYKKCSPLTVMEYKKHLIERMEQVKDSKWLPWAMQTSKEIKTLLDNLHGNRWITEILHIQHVKSYAPHVDHVVLDLKCFPAEILLQ